ncbi:unnamed protein product, partial [Coregonus sp. 'balchen']
LKLQGTEHQYQLIWTSHDGRHSNTTIATITSSTCRSVLNTLGFSKGSGYNLSMRPNFGNAGEFVFMQTTPAPVIVVRFEAFAFKGTLNKPVTLFRESSNSSEVKMMFRSLSWYSKASWTKSTSPVEAPTALTSDDRLEIDRFSSPTFNHIYFPLRVSPVAFEDGGLFRCNFNSHLMSYVELTTIQVSASGGPPGGQSVVLKCEVSEVSGDPVTLAWLRMEGRRGLLVKQDVLTESHPNRTLSVTLPSLHSDQLYWQCGVFIEGMLRASVPLRLRGAGGRSGLPSPLKDYTQQTLIIATCTALVVAGILIGSLVFYLKRKKTDPAVTSLSLTQKNDPVYVVSPLFSDYFSHSKDYDITVKPKFECAGLFFVVARTQPERDHTLVGKRWRSHV